MAWARAGADRGSRIVALALLGAAYLHAQTSQPAQAQSGVQLAGVNLAGAEFGQNVPGVFGTDYIYPSPRQIDYYISRGLNTIRIPFRWERLQRVLNSKLDVAELTRIDKIVKHATSREITVILDPHNYARYNGYLVGSAQVPVSAFKRFWMQLGRRFGANPNVVFGLMNEPHNMPTERWLTAANAAVAGIREVKAKNLILIPGNAWTGAHSWQASWYGLANAAAMPRINDPLRNFAFEVHQYLDADFSGTSASCSNAAGALAGIERMTAWLRQKGYRAFLGEIGVGPSKDCRAGLDRILTHLDAHADAWLGWAYWAGGPWWGSYFMSVEPVNGVDKPQMAVLREHRPKANRLTAATAAAGNPTARALGGLGLARR